MNKYLRGSILFLILKGNKEPWVLLCQFYFFLKKELPGALHCHLEEQSSSSYKAILHEDKLINIILQLNTDIFSSI